MCTLRYVMILAVSFVGTSFACEYPALEAVPSGEDATMDELLATQAQIREYMTAMEEYLVCVNEETEATGDNAPEVYGQIMAERHNSAVLEMEKRLSGTMGESTGELVRQKLFWKQFVKTILISLSFSGLT